MQPDGPLRLLKMAEYIICSGGLCFAGHQSASLLKMCKHIACRLRWRFGWLRSARHLCLRRLLRAGLSKYTACSLQLRFGGLRGARSLTVRWLLLLLLGLPKHVASSLRLRLGWLRGARGLSLRGLLSLTLFSGTCGWHVDGKYTTSLLCLFHGIGECQNRC